MKITTRQLTQSAILLALAVLLSEIKIFDLPYGGSLTLFSMLPVCLISYHYGISWGLFCGLTYGVLQGLLGSRGGAFAAMHFWELILMLALDYVFAYAMLGLTAIGHRLPVKSDRARLAFGMVIAAAARLVMHMLSGIILFSSYAEWFFGQEGFTFGQYVLEHMRGFDLTVFYAFFYNASFLVPDTLIAVIGAVCSVGLVKKLMK